MQRLLVAFAHSSSPRAVVRPRRVATIACGEATRMPRRWRSSRRSPPRNLRRVHPDRRGDLRPDHARVRRLTRRTDLQRAGPQAHVGTRRDAWRVRSCGGESAIGMGCRVRLAVRRSGGHLVPAGSGGVAKGLVRRPDHMSGLHRLVVALGGADTHGDGDDHAGSGGGDRGGRFLPGRPGPRRTKQYAATARRTASR